MIYFANPTNHRVASAIAATDGLGVIITAGQGNAIPPRTPWIADNECFEATKFRPRRFLAMLDRRSEHRQTCVFVTVPDVVGDAAATLRRWRVWQPILAGWPLAYVAQDGADATSVPWSDMSALFVGGSTEWKLGADAAALAECAHSKGMWVHMGRVNSRRRTLYAASIGCDSVDGTALTFRPDEYLPDVRAWAREARTQQCLI
jgi:hypothetical protein